MNVSDSPGPGKYDSRGTNESPKFSLSGRDQLQVRNNSPGPGQYDPRTETVIRQLPSCRLGTAPRESIISHVRPIPGPGTDTIRPTTGETSKWSFHQEKRNTFQVSANPGPGTYDVRSPRDGREYSLGARRPVSSGHIKENPGPGAYSVIVRERGQNFSVSKSPRKFGVPDNGVPGPGSYAPQPTKPFASNPCISSVGLARANDLISILLAKVLDLATINRSTPRKLLVSR